MNTCSEPMPKPKHQWLVLLVGLGVAAVAVALVYAVLLSASNSSKINERQKDAITTIDNTSQILTTIEGCTTPGERCYERGRRQMARAVADVNRVVVLAATCASGTETREELYIQQCILDQLAEQTGTRDQ